jgi:hypothetical protein
MDNKEAIERYLREIIEMGSANTMGEMGVMDKEYKYDSDDNTPNNIDYSDNIKIVDKYTFNNKINENELEELKNILCLREINKPILLNNIGLNPSIDANKNKDILEKLFLIYELCDDFEPSNINMLLDLLDGVCFTIEIGGSNIIHINLGFVSFICDEIGEDIIYLNIVELKEQIKTGEFNYHKHKYRDLIEHLLEDNKFGNKILIIPIFLCAFINNLPLKLFKWHDLRYKLYGNDKLNKFIKNIYISEQTINFVNRKIIKNYPKFKLTILQMYSSIVNINTGRDISNYMFPDLWFFTKDYKYFTIKITPNYSEIDKNIWSDAINILPNINSISYIIDGINKKTFIPSEIALIRKTTNGHIYVFSTDPNISIKNFIKNTIKENGDGLELIYKGLYVLQNKDETHQSYKKYNKDNSNEKGKKYIDLHIVLNIETPTIPISIIVNTYKKNNLQFFKGMAGAECSN